MRVIAIDTETTGLDPRKDRVRLVQMYDGQEMRITDAFKEPSIMDELLAICEDTNIVKIFHNAKFDLSFVRAHANRRPRYSNIHDTLLAEQVLMAGWSYPYYDSKAGEVKKRLPEYNLAAVVKRHLGFTLEKDMQRSNWGSAELTREQMEYAARDVEVLFPIYEIQCKLLEMNNLTHINAMECNALGPIIEMEYVGLPFSWDEAEQLRVQKKAELVISTEELNREVMSSQRSRQTTLFGDTAGIDMNLNSPAQVTRYLKDKLGFDVDSSDVETLKSLEHPFAEKLLKFRTLEKQINFIQQFEDFGAKSGRLYPSYNQNRAATGRMSSSRPNGQQVPKRGDGKVFRKLFRAPPGRKIIRVDFSAIELRIMCRLARDEAMLSALQNGVDLHKLTASKTGNVPLEDVTKDQRQRAKAVNFGLIYGMSAPTLKKYAWYNYNVRMSEQEAEDTRNAFFQLYNGICKWHIDQKDALYNRGTYYCHSHDKGYYTMRVAIQQTVSGRKRFWSDFAGESLAKPSEYYNSGDQGTSADITKLSLIKLYDVLPDDVHLIGAVHDEIICDAPESKAQEIADLMLRVMCEVGNEILDPVPVTAEAEIAQSWGGD